MLKFIAAFATLILFTSLISFARFYLQNTKVSESLLRINRKRQYEFRIIYCVFVLVLKPFAESYARILRQRAVRKTR